MVNDTTNITRPKTPKFDVRARFLSFYTKYLSQYFATLFLVIVTQVIVVSSVESAEWVVTSSLTIPLLIATALGFGVAKKTNARFRWHVLSVILGIIVIYYQGSTLIEEPNVIDRFTVLTNRLWVWTNAIIGQDASADVLPFALLLILITWHLGYWCTWTLFRTNNVWWVIIPSSVLLIINLSWLPESYYKYFFAYLGAALLLVAQVTALNKQIVPSNRDSLDRLSESTLKSVKHATWLAALVLTITIMLPVSGWTNFLMVEASNKILDPVDKMRVELNRFFAVGAKIPTSLKHFGSVLPIHRPIPDGDEPILLASHQIPAYWRLRTYSDYTSTAWRVKDVDFNSLEALVIPGSIESALSAQVEHDLPEPENPYNLTYIHVKLLADAPFLLVAGDIQGLDLYQVGKTASGQVHAPISYIVNIEEKSKNTNLPADLKTLAHKLSSAPDQGRLILDWVKTSGTTIQTVTKIYFIDGDGNSKDVSLDPDSPGYQLTLQESLSSESKLSAIEIYRGPSTSEDILAVRTKPQIGEDQGYGFAPDVTIPSEETLRNSGQKYPDWIKDRYLSLPPSMPTRIQDLATSLTEGLTNPYDKVVAIEEFLRGLTYTNSPLPSTYDQDATDHFLFDTQEGHSDHFTSAMAIMARSLGIPSRLALGYGPGEDDPDQKAIVVRDRDSHTWPEVYFQDHGWIEFEPSPIYNRRPRDVSQTEPLTSSLDSPVGPGTIRNISPSNDQDAEEPMVPPNSVGGRLPGGLGPYPTPLVNLGSPLGRDGLFFALIIVGSVFLVGFLWKRYFWDLRKPEEAYRKLMRLAVFLGLPSRVSDTPFEFAARLSKIAPKAAEDIHLICYSFANLTYGGTKAKPIDVIRLSRAWFHVRKALTKELLHAHQIEIIQR